jgi:hypothetical protein
MEKTRAYNKEKLIKLSEDFPAAYKKYLCDEIDRANESRTDEEFDRIVETRLTEEQHFVEYLLDNGIGFQRVGHWVCGNDDQDSWTCSECSFPVMPVDYCWDPYEAEIEYCEKCGARMIKPKKSSR